MESENQKELQKKINNLKKEIEENYDTLQKYTNEFQKNKKIADDKLNKAHKVALQQILLELQDKFRLSSNNKTSISPVQYQIWKFFMINKREISSIFDEKDSKNFIINNQAKLNTFCNKLLNIFDNYLPQDQNTKLRDIIKRVIKDFQGKITDTPTFAKSHRHYLNESELQQMQMGMQELQELQHSLPKIMQNYNANYRNVSNDSLNEKQLLEQYQQLQNLNEELHATKDMFCLSYNSRRLNNRKDKKRLSYSDPLNYQVLNEQYTHHIDDVLKDIAFFRSDCIRHINRLKQKIDETIIPKDPISPKRALLPPMLKDKQKFAIGIDDIVIPIDDRKQIESYPLSQLKLDLRTKKKQFKVLEEIKKEVTPHLPKYQKKIFQWQDKINDLLQMKTVATVKTISQALPQHVSPQRTLEGKKAQIKEYLNNNFSIDESDPNSFYLKEALQNLDLLNNLQEMMYFQPGKDFTDTINKLSSPWSSLFSEKFIGYFVPIIQEINQICFPKYTEEDISSDSFCWDKKQLAQFYTKINNDIIECISDFQIQNIYREKPLNYSQSTSSLPENTDLVHIQLASENDIRKYLESLQQEFLDAIHNVYHDISETILRDISRLEEIMPRSNTRPTPPIPPLLPISPIKTSTSRLKISQSQQSLPTILTSQQISPIVATNPQQPAPQNHKQTVKVQPMNNVQTPIQTPHIKISSSQLAVSQSQQSLPTILTPQQISPIVAVKSQPFTYQNHKQPTDNALPPIHNTSQIKTSLSHVPFSQAQQSLLLQSSKSILSTAKSAHSTTTTFSTSKF